MKTYVTEHLIVQVMQIYLQLQASHLSDSPSSCGLQHIANSHYICRYM